MACWTEWKQACAVALCGEESQRELHAFAHSRFRVFLRRYASRTNARPLSPPATGIDPPDAWHLFETHLVVKSTRRGKRYKDWLFARTEHSSDPPLDVVQGGASLIMRDVVREHLRREYSPSSMVSLQQPITDTQGTPLTVEDLLPGSPGPDDDILQRECEQLAERHAREECESMPPREKVAVLAKTLGLPLTHPAVMELAGCRKSVLSTTYRGVLERLALRLQRVYHEEDGETVLMLTLLTTNEIKREILSWGASEPSCAQLFRVVEGVVAPDATDQETHATRTKTA